MRERTSVSIERKLRDRATREAKRRGISVSSLMNEVLADHFRKSDPSLKPHPFEASNPGADIDATVYDEP